MYYNNSNRLLTESYQETIKEMDTLERQRYDEKISRKVLDTLDNKLIKRVEGRIKELGEHEKRIKNNPSSYKFLPNFDLEEEQERIDDAMTIGRKLINAMKDLVEKVESHVKIDKDSDEERKSSLVVIGKMIKEVKKLNDAFRTILNSFPGDC